MIDESVIGQLVKKAVKRKGLKLGEVAVESPFGRPSEIRFFKDRLKSSNWDNSILFLSVLVIIFRLELSYPRPVV